MGNKPFKISFSRAHAKEDISKHRSDQRIAVVALSALVCPFGLCHAGVRAPAIPSGKPRVDPA